MKHLLNRLYEHDFLSRQEAYQTLLDIAAGACNEVQLAAFATVYNMRPITLSELQGFRDALLELCVPLDLMGIETIDVVGTGGDGKNTFNISTASCVVIAGAGYKVSKHGSYGVSSAVGSSDVLLQLGYRFSNDQDTLRQQLDTSNLCFLHAPLFHPALKVAAPVRKQLGTKTFFNMLGPLVNPVQPKYQLFGTFSMELLRMYQYVMQQSGRRFAIVHALDGYDEVSLTGDFKLVTNDREQILSPKDVGASVVPAEALFGGDTAGEAADIFLRILQNEAPAAQKQVVAVNAGLAIHTIKPESPIQDCVAEAMESIESGKAYARLKDLIG
ncbi:MAG: anthranilate phosphoribosyltransferase [Saprospiraceae bacterium]|jgi:anthranilate phosphoribosyltransferase